MNNFSYYIPAPPPCPPPILIHPSFNYFYNGVPPSYAPSPPLPVPCILRRGKIDVVADEDSEEEEDPRWPELPEIYNADLLSDLMMCRWGRYQVLRFFIRHHHHSDIIFAVVRILSSNSDILLSISIDPDGAMSMREFLRNLKLDGNICILLSALAKIAPDVAMSPHGWRVIKYCVTRFSFKQNLKLLKNISRNCCKLALDRHGSRVLQYCLALARGEVEEFMLQHFLNHATVLAENGYGNLVIQHLLVREGKTLDFFEQLVKRFSGAFGRLSMSKYGSCVVEQFLITGGGATVDIIVDELIKQQFALVHNPFANRVANTAANLSRPGMLRDRLLLLIGSHKPVY